MPRDSLFTLENKRKSTNMIKNYLETFYSKLHSDIQENLYLLFKKTKPRDKILIFVKLKYGDEITFKEISEKMHFSTVRSIYVSYINMLKSGILEDLNG